MNRIFKADKIKLKELLGRKLTDNEYIQLICRTDRITKKTKQGMDYMNAIESEKSLEEMSKPNLQSFWVCFSYRIKMNIQELKEYLSGNIIIKSRYVSGKDKEGGVKV